MQSHDLSQFRQLLTDVMAYYGKDCSKFMLSVWWQALNAFDLEQVQSSLQRHATDAERGQFAPKVADIGRLLQGTTTDRRWACSRCAAGRPRPLSRNPSTSTITAPPSAAHMRASARVRGTWWSLQHLPQPTQENDVFMGGVTVRKRQR